MGFAISVQGAGQPASPAKPKVAAEAAARPTLEQRLAEEKARLERLRAELKQLEASDKGQEAGDKGQEAGDKGQGAGDKGQGSPSHSPLATGHPPLAASPLLLRPSLPAADVLYRLGRYKEAQAVYGAAARQPTLGKPDRIWALLQAGNCCRRLGDYPSAIAHFQTLTADYPDDPFTKGHVAWALKTAQWEKRWQRLELKSGD